MNNIKDIRTSNLDNLLEYVDNRYRDSVVPKIGSILYFIDDDENTRSGIYIDSDNIVELSSIGVDDGIPTPQVLESTFDSFKKRILEKMPIYISCNTSNAHEDSNLANYAKECIGRKDNYYLLYKSSINFINECIQVNLTKPWEVISEKDYSADNFEINISRDLNLKDLKEIAKSKLGLSRWLLWDLGGVADKKIDISKLKNSYEDLKADSNNIKKVKEDLEKLKNYQMETSNEDLPTNIILLLEDLTKTLEDLNEKFLKANRFIQMTGSSFSLGELTKLNVNFKYLVDELMRNNGISKILDKIGRNYKDEEKKVSLSLDYHSPTEVFGVYKSNNPSRMLPSELLNLEDEDLETLFFARLLESNLMSYELACWSEEFQDNNIKGPIILCLDTSGSMNGRPILKAKALITGISKRLKKEKRSLYLLLFGSKGECIEESIDSSHELSKLFNFLEYGYGGGTDFTTPLNRSFEILEDQNDYKKADILMVTDGYANLSDNFIKTIKEKKKHLNFNIYTIICDSSITKDKFSDEIISI